MKTKLIILGTILLFAAKSSAQIYYTDVRFDFLEDYNLKVIHKENKPYDGIIYEKGKKLGYVFMYIDDNGTKKTTYVTIPIKNYKMNKSDIIQYNNSMILLKKFDYANYIKAIKFIKKNKLLLPK